FRLPFYWHHCSRWPSIFGRWVERLFVPESFRRQAFGSFVILLSSRVRGQYPEADYSKCLRLAVALHLQRWRFCCGGFGCYSAAMRAKPTTPQASLVDPRRCAPRRGPAAEVWGAGGGGEGPFVGRQKRGGAGQNPIKKGGPDNVYPPL